MINSAWRNKLCFIVSIFLAMTAAQGRAFAQARVEDEEAIKRVVMAMDDAFNSHTPDSALFTRDADFVNVTGTWLKGAADIETGRRLAFETRLKNAHTKSLDVRIRFIRPDVAIVHVTSETTGIATSEGRELPPQKELNVRVLSRENGQWLVATFHNTPLR
jgi:uncharacterized protein (TIGR02246 family)